MNTCDQTPADWTGRIYFVAYTMFTMGNGDILPNGEVWQIITALTNGSGMFMITLAITYLLSVIAAVVHKRAFANQVTGMGKTAEEFVSNSWNLFITITPLFGLKRHYDSSLMFLDYRRIFVRSILRGLKRLGFL